MKYDNLSKEELLNKIYHLEALNKELLKEKEQETKLEYAWTGNLGHWYWNVQENSVSFNPLKITSLGYTKDEIPEEVSYQFFTDKLHPDDYEKTMDAMRNHLVGKVNVYEVEYRIQCKNGDYKWYYDIGKITQYDSEGKPLLLAGIVFDITEKKCMELELENKNKILMQQALVDELTGMYNYRATKEYLDFQVKESKENENDLTIIVFDIDKFKCLNDTRGHIFGNQVLSKVSEIIKENIRKSDMAGRFGGEEFIVILPETKLETAIIIAERIRKAVEKNDFYGVKVTISGGVTQCTNEDVEALIENADKNLYMAKETGRNKIIYT